MDSLTQVVLGAAVGEAVLGKKLGNRAMLWGAIAGTIPDLDVLLRYFVDEISATDMHRGFSHSIVFAVLISPILAWIAQKIHHKRQEVTFRNWCWLFFWTTVTHPLLDAHTTWGTQFFWPFEYRLAYQNIFVIDPLYTLPFLILLIAAAFHKRTHPRRQKLNWAGLIISTSYMALTLVFKWVAHEKFEEGLADNHIHYVELDTKPTPLNTILWNAQIETENGYRMAYYSIFDSQDIEFSEEFPKNDHLIEPYKDQEVIQKLIKITAGWYFVEEYPDKLLFWDIRFGQMGVDPNNSPFLWAYELKIDENGKVNASRADIDFSTQSASLFADLMERLKGN